MEGIGISIKDVYEWLGELYATNKLQVKEIAKLQKEIETLQKKLEAKDSKIESDN